MSIGPPPTPDEAKASLRKRIVMDDLHEKDVRNLAATFHALAEAADAELSDWKRPTEQEWKSYVVAHDAEVGLPGLRLVQ